VHVESPGNPGRLPTVSVIIVTHNGQDHLRRCLESLARQTFTGFEVLVVDNGSVDPIPAVVAEFGCLDVRLLDLGRNTGFAAANNRGAAMAQGRWLALLNSDAFPEPAWLDTLLARARARSEFSFFSSQQVSAADPDIIDGTGDMYALNGRAWRRDYLHRASETPRQEEEVWGACAASALYLRSVFEEAGGFDEEYFCYSEDVDLAFRLRLRGYRCLHVPDAVVHHIGSATSGGERSAFAVYHGFRNSEWTWFKNMPWPLVITLLPAHAWLIVTELRYARSIGQLRTALRAKRDGLRGLPGLFARRREVQRARRIGIDELRRVMHRR
jgi:GT2 family glycosyltransferase